MCPTTPAVLCCAAADIPPDTDHSLWGIQQAPLPPSGLVGRDRRLLNSPLSASRTGPALCLSMEAGSQEPKPLFQPCSPFILCTALSGLPTHGSCQSILVWAIALPASTDLSYLSHILPPQNRFGKTAAHNSLCELRHTC